MKKITINPYFGVMKPVDFSIAVKSFVTCKNWLIHSNYLLYCWKYLYQILPVTQRICSFNFGPLHARAQIHGLVQERRNSIAYALELRLSCTNPSRWNLLDTSTETRNLQFVPCATMMTSSNGNIFRVTGHLCGEFTGHRWITSKKASDAEIWCFLWSAPE